MKDYFATDKWYPDGFVPDKKLLTVWEWMKTNMLNPMREHVGVPISISNGVRTIEDYYRLIKEGYLPSSTSDHFAMQVVQINEKDTRKRAIYGEFYNLSTLATDLVGDFDKYQLCRDLYLTITKRVDENSPHFVKGFADVKQLIHEVQGSKEWIHISVPYEAIYTKEVSNSILSQYPVSKFLKMRNGKYSSTDFNKI